MDHGRRKLDEIIVRFGNARTDTINTRDFLRIIDYLDKQDTCRTSSILSTSHRDAAKDIVEAEVPMTRNELKDFLARLEVPLDLEAHIDGPPASATGKSAMVSHSYSPTGMQIQDASDHGIKKRNALTAASPRRYRFPDQLPTEERMSTTPRSTGNLLNPENVPLTDTKSPKRLRHGTSATAITDTIALVDHQKAIHERKRSAHIAISHAELEIHNLTQKVSDYETELLEVRKSLADSRIEHAATQQALADHQVHIKDDTGSSSHLQRSLDRMRAANEHNDTEIAHLRLQIDVRDRELEDLRARMRHLTRDAELWQKDKGALAAELASLKSGMEEHTTLQARLDDALQACKLWEAQVLEMKRDNEEMPKSTIRQSRRLDISMQQDNDQDPRDVLKTESLISTGDGNRAADEQAKQHYAMLSNELGLQRNLIDKMLRMKKSVRQTRTRELSNTRSQGSDSRLSWSTLYRWSDSNRAWPVFAFYSCVLIIAGYLFAACLRQDNLIYGESQILHSFGKSQSLSHISLTTAPQRWWEGGWTWLEIAGFWLEASLIDSPWPT